MTKEQIMQIINNMLAVDGKAVRAKDVVATVPHEVLIALVALLIGKCE